MTRLRTACILPAVVSLVGASLVVSDSRPGFSPTASRPAPDRAIATVPHRIDPRIHGFVLISIDTLRADHLGVYGRRPSPSPRIDALASHGAVYLEARSQVPLTLPSHTVMLTGRLPAETGVRDNGIFRLGDGVPTLAERLSRAGFRCGGFVGTFLLSRRFGLDRGFEIWDDDLPVGGALELPERRAGEVVGRAKRWLDRIGDSRFFLFVHLFDPHAPYAAPEPWATRFRDPYDAEIAYADSAVGDLLDHLRTRGLAERVGVALVSDHGESLGEHGERTHGFFLYEATLRVPLILRVPGVIPPGRRIAGPARLLDLAPTILVLLGVDAPDGSRAGAPPSATPAKVRTQQTPEPASVSRGRPLWPQPPGSVALPDVPVYAETLYPFYSYRWSGSHALVRGGRKLILSARSELYDVAKDPKELTDLATRDAAGLARMREELVRTAGATGGERTTVQEPNAEVLEKLHSLGYASGAPARGGEDEIERRLRLPDPKDRIRLIDLYDEAVVRLRHGDFKGGRRMLEEVIRQDAGNVDAHTLLASAAYESGDLARSEQALRAALAIDPARADLRGQLARTLARAGRFEEARTLVEQALAAQPALPDVLRLRATLEARRGELAAARRDLEAEARFLPPAEGRSSPESELAELLLSAGDETAARKWVDTALAARPHEAKALMLRGLLSARSGNLAAARRDFAASVSANPSAGKALLMLAEAEAESGDLAAALGHFDKALHAGPESPELLNAYAAALLRAGRKDRARELLLRSEALRPGQAGVRELLGKAGAKPAPAGR